MRIAVAGLGIMGASIARALKANTKYVVDGWNRSYGVVEYALEKGYIDRYTETFVDYDVVFVAMPVAATIEFLQTKEFKDRAIVVDICGVKDPVEKAVYAQNFNYRYVGSHPMAGKETSGIQSASQTLFQGANVILTRHEKTDEEALTTVVGLYKKMGCGKVLLCPASYHDEKIAYTSQLAHIVSNAYLKSNNAAGCSGFTGGSFQDMTRVGGVDEELWTELYFLNRESLKAELKTLIENLGEYLTALEEGDEQSMKSLLKEGSEIHRSLKCY